MRGTFQKIGSKNLARQHLRKLKSIQHKGFDWIQESKREENYIILTFHCKILKGLEVRRMRLWVDVVKESKIGM